MNRQTTIQFLRRYQQVVIKILRNAKKILHASQDKMKKSISSIKAGEWLNFAGVIIGIIFSFIIAFCTFNAQEKATKRLENRLKFSEIVIDIHKNIRLCKDDFKSISSQIEREGFDQYSKIITTTVFTCRSRLVPFVSGLKIFKDGEIGAKEHKYLSSLDSRMNEIYQKTNDLVLTDQPISKYQQTTNEVMSLSISKNKNLATLDGLEELLLE